MKLTVKNVRRLISEEIDAFRMKGARVNDVPSNFHGGDMIVGGVNSNVLHDEEVENDKIRQDTSTMPQAVTLLILSSDGYYLAVSRKDDPTDFGLPGGKVDPGEDLETAARRELKEETGLDVVSMKPVFADTDGMYYVTTFLAQVEGEINTPESGLVRWVTADVLYKGKFGSYNKKLLASIK